MARTTARCPSVPPLTNSTPALATQGSRRTRPAARRLLVLAQVLPAAAILAAVFAVSALGLSRPAPARAAVAVAWARKPRLGAWRYALRQHGKPYQWGGNGPVGFDCSGLVDAAYRASGISLPRTTYGMLSSGRLIRIRKSRARRGDLAFFGSGHVELYDHGRWTFGAAEPGTRIGYHRMSRFWHPTMYFRVRR